MTDKNINETVFFGLGFAFLVVILRFLAIHDMT
jgi:hypothetical protein